jgi:hypothetical protein
LDVVGPHEGTHQAYYDWPLNHDYCQPTLGRDALLAGEIVLTVLACVESAGDLFTVIDDVFGTGPCSASFSVLSGSDFCRSDWNIHTQPLSSNDGKNWSFLAPGNLTPRNDFEIEFEWQYALDDIYWNGFEPDVGDMVAAHGRSIVDCAHCDPYKAEIHPPDTLVVSRSRVTNFGNAPSRRSTEAYIWVNEFLNGIAEATPPENIYIEGGSLATSVVPIYAPPRTSARATLLVTKNEQGYAQSENVVVTRETDSTGAQMSFAANVPPKIPAEHYGQWHRPEGKQLPKFVDFTTVFWIEQ